MTAPGWATGRRPTSRAPCTTGVRPGGAHLYPAFPYPYYTRLTRAGHGRDLRLPAHATALRAPGGPRHAALPVQHPRCAWRRGTPCSSRPARSAAEPGHTAEYDRGAYLVGAAGHCGACHTPMNLLGASKDARFLQGNQHRRLDRAQHHQRRTPAAWAGGRWRTWSPTCSTGRNAGGHGQRSDGGGGAVLHLPHAGVRPARHGGLPEGARRRRQPRPGRAAGRPTPPCRQGRRSTPTPAQACHDRAGAGVANIFPRLAGNPDVLQDDPATLVRVVLAGARGAATGRGAHRPGHALAGLPPGRRRRWPPC